MCRKNFGKALPNFQRTLIQESLNSFVCNENPYKFSESMLLQLQKLQKTFKNLHRKLFKTSEITYVWCKKFGRIRPLVAGPRFQLQSINCIKETLYDISY
ncbi:hypothetical protein LEP1GSC082_4130 [Leptospira kirschneri str. H2]|nr:hypothetical protein LEP1GSC082_4130 [Leptospira kirschneri str. H2]